MPSIHIIVKHGRVTLEGIVSSQTDITIAGMAARDAPGIFSVTNNLKLDK